MHISPALPALCLRLGCRQPRRNADWPAAGRASGLGSTGRAGGDSIRGVIPRLGGMALYARLHRGGAGDLPAAAAHRFPPRLDPKEMRRLIGLLMGTTAVFVFGLLDDRFELPSRPQYLAQFLSSADRHRLHHLHRAGQQPVRPGPDRLPVAGRRGALTIFWFMGMMNTVNWLDGLDGLAAASRRFSRFLAIHMIREGAVRASRCCRWRSWARRWASCRSISTRPIFMGSSGSYFLGGRWRRWASSAGRRWRRCCWRWGCRSWTSRG